MEWYWQRKIEELGEDFSQWHCFHLKSHKDCRGNKPDSRKWKAGDLGLRYGRAQDLFNKRIRPREIWLRGVPTCIVRKDVLVMPPHIFPYASRLQTYSRIRYKPRRNLTPVDVFYNALNNRSEFTGKLLLSYYFLLQNPHLQLLSKKSTSFIRDFISPVRKKDTEI